MFRRLLVPTDLTEATRRALDAALSLATPGDAEVALLHVIERVPNLEDREMRTFYEKLEHDARQWMRELTGKTDVSGGLTLVSHVTLGRRPDEIVRFAETDGSDLVILHHDADRGPLLGSTTYKVSILAPCSVLILK